MVLTDLKGAQLTGVLFIPCSYMYEFQKDLYTPEHFLLVCLGFFPATAIVIKPKKIEALPDLTLLILKQTHFEWADLSSYLDGSQASSLFITSSALCHLSALSAMSLHCF